MKITAKTKGIISDLSNADYHSNRTHYSSTVLKEALDDPLQWFEVYIEGKSKTVSRQQQDNFDYGNCAHTMILEPEKLMDEYAFYTGPVRNGKVWDSFELQNTGKTILTSSQKYNLDRQITQFNSQEVLLPECNTILKGPQLFTKGLPEESFFTEIEGLPVKCRSDWRSQSILKHWLGDSILDLKTTQGTPNTKSEAKYLVTDLKYHVSAALYVDIIYKVTGIYHPFYWVFLSKTDYKLNVYKASEETLSQGRDLYKQAIESIKYWKASGNYTKVSQIREL
jgi:exodeoxyribonuclease VIII